MRFHEGEEGEKERLERMMMMMMKATPTNDEDVNSLMKVAPLLLYMHCETGRQLSLYLSQIECI